MNLLVVLDFLGNLADQEDPARAPPSSVLPSHDNTTASAQTIISEIEVLYQTIHITLLSF